MKSTLYIVCMAVLLLACSEDEPVKPAVPTKGKLQIAFEPLVNGVPLKLFEQKYLSPANDTFEVQQFKFFVRFRSISSENTKQEWSYFYKLINFNSEVTISSFVIDSLEAGEYNQLVFDVGIDSVNNHSTDRLGELAPGSGMTWDWNTGYKFLLLEGKHYNSTATGLVFHIGEDRNYKSFSFALPSTIKIENGKTSEIKIAVEINEMFSNPHSIDFDTVNEAMFGSEAAKIADNYAEGMFSIKKIINP